MVLVDTSVWIDHFRKENRKLSELLNDMQVLSHHSIIAELALGQMKKRSQIIGNLKLLPKAISATPEELLEFIEVKKLYGKGLSLTDIELLLSALLSNVKIYSFDKGMVSVGRALSIETV